MGPDLRYHLATLITVLFAVIVGVIIGANLTDPKELQRREDRLNTKVDNALKETRRVGQEAALARQAAFEAKQAEEFAAKSLLAPVVRNKLLGRRVALVHSGGLPTRPARSAIETVLQLAGAEPASFTTFDARLAGDGTALEALATQLQWPVEANQRLEHFARAAAAVFATGDAAGLMKTLSDAKLAQLASDYKRPVHAVVLLGGADDKQSLPATTLDRALIKALLAAKLTVVGCESSTVPTSSMAEYARQHISTVDNIESWSGQVSLVWTLAGQRGHYGTKSGASAKLPPLMP